jgi:hypothetical protein
VIGVLVIAAFLATAWLLSRFVDWSYRTGLGEPAAEAPVVPEPARPAVLTRP